MCFCVILYYHAEVCKLTKKICLHKLYCTFKIHINLPIDFIEMDTGLHCLHITAD